MDRALIERFTNEPRCFYLEWNSEPPRTTQVDIIDWANLRSNGFRWRTRKLILAEFSTFRSHSLRITDCRCDVSTSSHPAHRRYQEACLRTLKTLVSEYTSEARFATHHPGFRDSLSLMEVESLIVALAGSSLLQRCAFEPELFVQCGSLFSLIRVRPLWVDGWTDSLLERRKRLLYWLEVRRLTRS